MPSLYKVKSKSGESYKIQEVINGTRKTLTLGKISKKTAEMVSSRIETVNSCNLAGMPYPPDIAQWLVTISDDLHEKLSNAGLVQPRHSRPLTVFLDSYMAERTDLKQSTRNKYATTVKNLTAYFGNTPLRNITPEQAALYRVHLVKEQS